MRISDWSSDVCSSDLQRTFRFPARKHAGGRAECGYSRSERSSFREPGCGRTGRLPYHRAGGIGDIDQPSRNHAYLCRRRSEEHTSELQSLMRISYAVFCLKKKNTHTPNTNFT